MVRNILPLIWISNPALTCKIIGHGWSPERLPGADPRVSVLGAVDDLDAVFDTVRLTIAPLRFGAGIKGKVLDSFAAGLPCVMTPMAAEGLPLTEPLKALVGDTPAALADRVLRFHADQPANEAVGREAMRFAAEGYSPDRVREALAAALGARSSVGAPTLARA
jgi:glycosyltransferase involved in cell wall biosynthesis